jgi:aryl carrier-like protein
MASLCVGALLVGIAATFFFSVTGLFLAALVAAVIGAVMSIARGADLLHVGLASFVCMALVQIGYGIGLVSLSLNPSLRKLQNKLQSKNLLASALHAIVSSKKTS